jgi:hypothetical protein
MIILTPIERETLQVFFKGSPCAKLPWFSARKQQYHGCCGAGRDMLTRVWVEMDYRIHVCRITKGGNIEYL